MPLLMRNRYCLAGVIHSSGRPDRLAFLVIAEGGGEYGLEVTADGRAPDDLRQSRGDDVVFHAHAALAAQGVDAIKPARHAGEEFHVPAQGDQVFPGQLHFTAGHLLHQVHIGQYAVHVVLPGEFGALAPEGVRLHANAGQEGILLHVPGRQRLVEVIDQGDDGCLHGDASFCGETGGCLENISLNAC